MLHTVQDSLQNDYNQAVIAGDVELARHLAAVWLWLIRMDRATVTTPARRPAVVARPTAVIKPRHRLMGSMGVRAKRPMEALAPMQPEPVDR